MKLLRKTLRAVANYDPSFCDMYNDPPSRLAAQEYFAHISRHLRETFGERPLTILDAGCQAGRFLIPLAQAGHRMIGIDRSGFALRRAKRHLRTLGLNAALHTADIGRLRRWVKPASVDAALCLEVLYLCRDFRELMRVLIESVKPGGLLAISHRPTEHYLSVALKQRQPLQAAQIAATIEGPTPEGEYYNWLTAAQVTAWYAELGLRVRGCDEVDTRTPVALDLTGANGSVAQLLQPYRGADGLFRIPQYRLVITQKGS